MAFGRIQKRMVQRKETITKRGTVYRERQHCPSALIGILPILMMMRILMPLMSTVQAEIALLIQTMMAFQMTQTIVKQSQMPIKPTAIATVLAMLVMFVQVAMTRLTTTMMGFQIVNNCSVTTATSPRGVVGVTKFLSTIEQVMRRH